MKSCPKCKVKISPGHDFCLSCGFKFAVDIKNKKGKPKLSALLQLMIGMVIGIVFILLFLFTDILPIIFFPITLIIYIAFIAFLAIIYYCLHQ